MKTQSKTTILLIIIGILLIIWIPYFLGGYDFTNACIITVSTMVGGAIGEYAMKKSDKEKNNSELNKD